MATHLFRIVGLILLMGQYVLSATTWGEWSEWTSCDCKEEQVRTRYCHLNQSVVVNICQGQSVEVRLCAQENRLNASCGIAPTAPTAPTASWQEWSNWTTQCDCTAEQVRFRKCTLNGTLANDCVGLSTDRRSCIIDTRVRDNCSSTWGPWEDNSVCSTTCGEGEVYRIRQCILNDNTLSTKCDGGLAVKHFHCNLQKCPGLWDIWAEWSTCSKTCGLGIKTRERNCTGLQKQHGDFNCTGGSPTEKENCTMMKCPDNPSMATWLMTVRQWISPWEHTVDGSETCSEMRKIRVRQCFLNDKTTSDETLYVQLFPCYLQKCPGTWSHWAEWTPCSKTCGLGIKTRERNCTGLHGENGDFNCTGGSPTETENCPAIKCPGTWSPWAEWTPCSETCGLGIKTRTRNCTGLHGENGDFNCAGGSPTETENCPVIKCPGTWSPWAEWTPCSETCGLGIKTRERNCTGLHGKNGDFNCTGGSGTGKENCTVIKCPGLWDTWSEWTECSQTCGTGYHIRVRNCTSYDHITLENDCLGKSVDYKTCAEISCPVITTTPPDSWTKWSSWSICTATCGGGVRYRSRNCTTYNLTQVNDCIGQSIETETCNNIFCEDSVSMSNFFGRKGKYWSYKKSFKTTTLHSTCTTCGTSSVNVSTAKEVLTSISAVKTTDAITTPTETSKPPGETTTAITQTTLLSTKDKTTATPSATTATKATTTLTTQSLPVWSEWTSWTACTHTCNGGAQVRSRECRMFNSTVSEKCVGQSVDYATCNNDSCPHTNLTPSTLSTSIAMNTTTTLKSGTIAPPSLPTHPATNTPVANVPASTSATFSTDVTKTTPIQSVTSATDSFSSKSTTFTPSTHESQITHNNHSNSHHTTTANNAAASTTTTLGTGTTQPPQISCFECQGDPDLCEFNFQPKTCTAPNNYCINELTNNADTTRLVVRRCGNYTECADDWWQTYSDDERCKGFEPDKTYNFAFYCKFCCIKDNCNQQIYPPQETNFILA